MIMTTESGSNQVLDKDTHMIVIFMNLLELLILLKLQLIEVTS